MKALLIIASIFLGSTSLAASCQILEGKFFYSDNPSQSLSITQDECVLTMTFENGGNVGKPIVLFGDGVWRVTHDTKYEKEIEASFAQGDAFRVETKTEIKRTAENVHIVHLYRLRADGNITMKSSVTDGEISDSGTRLLIRDYEVGE